jgi:hypothetical protein
MLTAKEMKSIPKGNWSNAALRQAFGKKHGSPVNEMTKEGKMITIIGNRFQRKFREKHPFKQLPVKGEKESFHGNRIEAAKKLTLMGKIIQFFAQMFNRKAA